MPDTGIEQRTSQHARHRYRLEDILACQTQVQNGQPLSMPDKGIEQRTSQHARHRYRVEDILACQTQVQIGGHLSMPDTGIEWTTSQHARQRYRVEDILAARHRYGVEDIFVVQSSQKTSQHFLEKKIILGATISFVWEGSTIRSNHFICLGWEVLLGATISFIWGRGKYSWQKPFHLQERARYCWEILMY